MKLPFFSVYRLVSMDKVFRQSSVISFYFDPINTLYFVIAIIL